MLNRPRVVRSPKGTSPRPGMYAVPSMARPVRWLEWGTQVLVGPPGWLASLRFPDSMLMLVAPAIRAAAMTAFRNTGLTPEVETPVTLMSATRVLLLVGVPVRQRHVDLPAGQVPEQEELAEVTQVILVLVHRRRFLLVAEPLVEQLHRIADGVLLQRRLQRRVELRRFAEAAGDAAGEDVEPHPVGRRHLLGERQVLDRFPLDDVEELLRKPGRCLRDR